MRNKAGDEKGKKRKVGTKEYMPYGSIYMKFKQAKLNYKGRCRDNGSLR